jgi:hypothetical protein
MARDDDKAKVGFEETETDYKAKESSQFFLLGLIYFVLNIVNGIVHCCVHAMHCGE